MREINPPDAALWKFLPRQKLRSDCSYRLTQFSWPFEYQGKRYLSNTFTRACIELDSELPLTVRAGDGCDALIEGQFYVPEDRDECAYYEKISALMRAYTHKSGPDDFTILPTLSCNARCIYCYEEGMQQVTMTDDVVEQTVQYIVHTHSGKKVRLNWFGGEPLLRPDLIDSICMGLQGADLEYRSGMTSNASLITPEIIDKMKGLWQLGHIQVSMDGCEQDYVARKQYVKAKDQYHEVIAHINLLADAGVAVTIRCNVDENNWDGIPAFIDDLRQGIVHKDQVALYFCPLDHVRRSEGNLDMWKKIFHIKPQILSAGFQTSGFNGTSGKLRIHHCMADAGDVVIMPDGGLYPCEHCLPDTRFGNVFHGVTNQKALETFCCIGSVREKCRKCPFLPECTAFSNCPIQDTNCREIRELIEADWIRTILDGKDAGGTDSASTTVC